MRPTLYILAAVACGAIGFAIAHAQPAAPGSSSIMPVAPPPTEASWQPSFVGRAVKLYFRGSDDLPFPEMEPTKTGQVSLAMKVTYFSGVIKQAKAGWIELAPADRSASATFWVSTQSVAYIVADDASSSTTRP